MARLVAARPAGGRSKRVSTGQPASQSSTYTHSITQVLLRLCSGCASLGTVALRAAGRSEGGGTPFREQSSQLGVQMQTALVRHASSSMRSSNAMPDWRKLSLRPAALLVSMQRPGVDVGCLTVHAHVRQTFAEGN